MSASDSWTLGDTVEHTCLECDETKPHDVVESDMGGKALRCPNYKEHDPLFGSN